MSWKISKIAAVCHIQIGKSQSRKRQQCFASNGRACRGPSLEAKWRALQPSSSTWANLRFRAAIAFYFTNIMNQWPVVFTCFYSIFLKIFIHYYYRQYQYHRQTKGNKWRAQQVPWLHHFTGRQPISTEQHPTSFPENPGTDEKSHFPVGFNKKRRSP